MEAVVGVAAGSLALLADAGHILTDVFALSVAWLAIRRARRPPDERHTFGYGRSGILAAVLNGCLLLLIAAVIGLEAFARLGTHHAVNGAPVIVAAATAMAVNLFIARTLQPESHHDLNVRAALVHVLGDVAASAAALISGAVILAGGSTAVDPLLSWVIALLVAVGAIRILVQATSTLMEAVPRDVDLTELSDAMRHVPGVEDVHDLHVWSLSDGLRLLSAHVAVPEQSLAATSPLLSDLRVVLRSRFNIQHSTIELECSDCTAPVTRPITLHGGPGSEIEE